jgi:hypothetical protein
MIKARNYVWIRINFKIRIARKVVPNPIKPVTLATPFSDHVRIIVALPCGSFDYAHVRFEHIDLQ